MTPKQFQKLVRMLPEKTPIHAACEKILQKRHITLRDAWYRSQWEHWQGWLSECDGAGAYNRKKPHKTAESVYNSIACPPMLIWLAEAVGLHKELVLKTKAIALTEGQTFPRQCGSIRKIVPWGMIADGLLAKAADKIAAKTKL